MRSSSFGFVVIIMIGLSTLNLPLDMNVYKGGGSEWRLWEENEGERGEATVGGISTE